MEIPSSVTSLCGFVCPRGGRGRVDSIKATEIPDLDLEEAASRDLGPRRRGINLLASTIV